MTAQPIAAPAAQRLEDLAAAYLEGEWTTALETTLYALAGDRPEGQTWALFVEFAALVDLRDGVNDGRVDWRHVDPDITGIDPSTTAYQVACQMADDAAHAVLDGGRR